MLRLYVGTDRDRARAEMNKAVAKSAAKKMRIVRITDTNTVADLQEALRGSGMFGEKRVVIFDGVFANEEMRSLVLDALSRIGKSDEPFYILEEKPDAETRRALEKHAEVAEKFEIKKEKKGGEIFALAYALRRGDKKALWVALQRALLRDEAPEAIHGVLFWGAKQVLLAARKGSPEHRRGAALVAELAELSHEARRQGFGLEYALEHYILSTVGRY